jgi:hypothetical protein
MIGKIVGNFTVSDIEQNKDISNLSAGAKLFLLTNRNPTKEDKFFDVFERNYPSYRQENNWLDFFTEVTSFDNVETDKMVGSGKWIKIRNSTGYEVHFAKEVRVDEFFLTRRIRENFKKGDEESLAQNVLFDISESINEKPYFIKIRKTRTTTKYLLPYQYELCDVQTYVDIILQFGRGDVNYKTLFTKEDKDKIFYLRSRGLGEDNAILLSKLEDLYFTINCDRIFAN